MDQSAGTASVERSRETNAQRFELSIGGPFRTQSKMTSSADPHDPRPIIIGVGFAVVLLAGALFTVFLQTWDSRWPGPAQKPDRLGFAEKVLQNGDDATAAKIFSELAAEDNGMAQYWLAHMTELGLGVSRDLPTAITLYKKAAAKNISEAERRLGEIYLRGDIVPPDFNRAKSYLEQAAYQGDARAAMQLSRMYRLGLGMPANPINAYAWSEVASLEGNTVAKRERDASLRDLKESNQQEAVALARDILNRIKREPPAPGDKAEDQGKQPRQ